MSNLLSQLNKEQQEAVRTTEGPVLVIAGAGSGKTRTLTHRAAYLIQKKKISPQNILAVTFTNKAANEMKSRVSALIKKNADKKSFSTPLVGTFHSICVQLLRKEIHQLGYKSTFNIFDDQDQVSLIKKLFKELEISKDQFNPRGVLGSISKAKNNLIDSEQFKSSTNGYYEETVAKVYSKYQLALHDNNALDFDDLILLTVKIFQTIPTILEKYQNLFRYIMVDEYQDTNHAQYSFINLLSQKHRNIFVVGDDFQSVYMWRGANIENILNFEKDYQGAKVIKLEQNYRSTQIILDAANEIIANNVRQKKKKIWTENKGGTLIKIYEAESERTEAEFIARKILDVSQKKSISAQNKPQSSAESNPEKKDYKDFAVLYRTNAQSRVIEEIFLKHSIPYRIIGGTKFYQRKEIKDIVAYLRFIYDSNDYIALERIINAPRRGIGIASLAKWVLFAKDNQFDFLTAGLKLDTSSGLNKSKIETISKFCNFINEMKAFKSKLNLSKFIQKVSQESGYEKMLEKMGEEGEVRWENVQELLSVAKKYKDDFATDSIQIFLEEVALSSDTDKIDQEQNAVHLMTLHSAKGLEFPTVFIVGMEEGILPHSRSLLSNNELEEERRLMYVGITRAEKEVYLLYTNLRTIFGSTQANAPSRFLDEIPEELVERITQTNSFSKTTHKDNSNSYSDNFLTDDKANDKAKTFADGERVNHPDFGEGVVLSVENDTLTIVFQNIGIKKISTKYTPLKKI
ncbi:MAG TPA: DUF3553 domain-containing protein [Candidatus Moranbacteria bacterium]|nr:DUF3553 domain-containing protein [Candidatus Moranbacteria bacterium]